MKNDLIQEILNSFKKRQVCIKFFRTQNLTIKIDKTIYWVDDISIGGLVNVTGKYPKRNDYYNVALNDIDEKNLSIILEAIKNRKHFKEATTFCNK